MERDEVIRKVFETSQAIADGYRLSGRGDEAIAASNTGYFILQALGLKREEIAALSVTADKS